LLHQLAKRPRLERLQIEIFHNHQLRDEKVIEEAVK
jgi:hypothetical protein